MAYTREDIIKQVRTGPESATYKDMSDDALFDRVVSVRPDIKSWIQQPPAPPAPVEPPSVYRKLKDMTLTAYRRMAGTPVPAEQITAGKALAPAPAAEFTPEQIVQTGPALPRTVTAAELEGRTAPPSLAPEFTLGQMREMAPTREEQLPEWQSVINKYAKRKEAMLRPARPGEMEPEAPIETAIRPRKISDIPMEPGYTQIRAREERDLRPQPEGIIRPVMGKDVGTAGRIGRASVGAIAGLGVGAGRLTAAVGEGYKGLAKALGDNAAIDFLGRAIERTGQAAVGTGKEIVRRTAISDPTALEHISGGLASTIPFFISGLGIMRMGQALKFAPVIAEAFGISAPSLLEAGMEAGMAQQDAIDRGLSDAQAKRIGTQVFAMNVPITLLGNKLGIFAKAKSIPGKFAQAYIAEGGQETLQTGAQNIASDMQPGVGAAQSFVYGGLAGGLIGAAHTAGTRPAMEAPVAPAAMPAPAPAPAAPTTLAAKITTQAQETPPPPSVPAPAPIPAPEPGMYPDIKAQETIWNMPTERLQERVLANKLPEPTWKTEAEIAEDMRNFPDGEAYRKWAAEKEIRNKLGKHTVPEEIIQRYGLEKDVEAAVDHEIAMREAMIKDYRDSRGGITPIWNAVKKMGFINKAKLMRELGIEKGTSWRGGEFPDELKYLVRKDGQNSPSAMAQALYQIGLLPENSVGMFFSMLQRDWEVKQAIKEGRDLLPIIRRSEIDPRDVWNTDDYGPTIPVGSGEYARRKPSIDLPGQQMIPGTGPAMPTGKIVREINVDPDDFIEGFIAQPDQDSLFSTLEEAATASKEMLKQTKAGSGDASTVAPAMDQPPAAPAPATFQPLTGDKQFKLWRVTEQLIEKYAKRFGEDKYRPRGAVGVYYPETGNIFLQAANNIFVAVHEVTHFVDTKTKWFEGIMRTIGTTKNGKPIYDPKTLPIRRLLTKMYMEFYGGATASAPLRTRLREGAAMMAQKAVEDPGIMDTPTWKPLYDAAIRAGGQHHNSTFAELIKDGQAAVKQFRGLSRIQQAQAMITSSDRKRNVETIFSKADMYQQEAFDDLHKFAVLDKHMGLTNTAESTYNAIHALKYVGAIGNVALEKGKGLYAVTRTGIKNVLDQNIGDLFDKIKTAGHADYMDGWLIMRRVNAGYERMDTIRAELMELTEGKYDIQNPDPQGLKAWLDALRLNMTPQEVTEMMAQIRELAREYRENALIAANDKISREAAKEGYEEGLRDFPKLAELADLHDEINGRIVDMLQEAGIVSAERAQKMRDNKAYASFRRDILTMHTSDGQPVFRPVDSLGMLKKRVGSELAFAGPLHGLILNYQNAVKLSMGQHAKNKIYDMVRKDPEFFGAAFERQDLKIKVNEDGSIEYPQLGNNKILMARKNGKYYPMAVYDDALMDVLSENLIGPGKMEAFEKVVRAMSRIFTKGTTGTYLPFAAVNLPMDIVSSFVQTQTKYKPLWDQGRTLYSILKDDGSAYGNYIREYMALTGGRQSLAHMYDENAPAAKAYEYLTGQMELTDKAINYGERALDAISAPSKLSEDLTRGSEYARAREAGLDVFTALEMAGQITAPFHHRGRMGGKLGRLWVSSVPYWNASTQVLAQMSKAAQTPENRKRMAIAMSALAVGMIFSSYQIRRASEAQRRKLRGMHPDERANAIWFPIPTAEARAAGTLGKVRVPENYAAAANLANMIIEEASKENNFDAGEYMDAATEILPDQWNVTAPRRMLFSVLPWIIQPAVQVATGKRTFPKVTELTPRSLQGLPIERQYGENTSEVAKAISNRIGKHFGLNPIEVDFLIEGYLGGRTTRFVTGRMGTRSITNNFYQDMYLNGMRDMEFFYNLRDRLDALSKAYGEDVKNAAAENRVRTVFPKDASVEQIVEQAATAGVKFIEPPAELRTLRTMAATIKRVEDRMARYRQLMRVKNPGPAAKAEQYQERDAVLDDVDLLRQRYEKLPLTK